MSTTLICDNVYQLYLAWALETLGAWPFKVGTMISVGDHYLAARSADVAVEIGWRHLHRWCPSSFGGQVVCGTALALRPPARFRELLSDTRSLIVFNDTHPCTVQIRGLCRQAPVTMIEEGTGLHRSRLIGRWSGRRWLSHLLVQELNLSGRQGEAPWVDELWVSHTDSLTPAQQRKRVVTFDRGAAVSAMRRRWGALPDLPEGDGPILLVVGQPFVEDGVLTRGQAEAMHREIAAALPPDLRGRMVCAYKPHPRERGPQHNATRILGGGALVLDRHVPLEILDFGARPVFALSLTSGAVRGLPGAWTCVSAARCFPPLAWEIGSANMFPGVRFLDDLGELPRTIDAFLTSTPRDLT